MDEFGAFFEMHEHAGTADVCVTIATAPVRIEVSRPSLRVKPVRCRGRIVAALRWLVPLALAPPALRLS